MHTCMLECTVHSAQCTVCSVQCAVCSVQCSPSVSVSIYTLYLARGTKHDLHVLFVGDSSMLDAKPSYRREVCGDQPSSLAVG
jgi:hypothetical protein